MQNEKNKTIKKYEYKRINLMAIREENVFFSLKYISQKLGRRIYAMKINVDIIQMIKLIKQKFNALNAKWIFEYNRVKPLENKYKTKDNTKQLNQHK